MADSIIKNAVRDAVDGLHVSADFYDALDDEVQVLLDDAERRAQDNGRKTVQARDL
jgi:histone H3/H4